MKRLITLSLMITISLIVAAQKKEIKDKFYEYTEKGVYSIDGNNIVVSAIINDVSGSKNDIYIKVKNYFTRTYRDANSVIQTDDKEQGVIIGKGLYNDFWTCSYMVMQTMEWSAYHILRVDIKDGKVRIIGSVSTMDYEFTATSPKKDYSYNIVDYAPITDKRMIDKGKQMEALVILIDKMHETINSLEKSLKEGNLSIENEDW